VLITVLSEKSFMREEKKGVILGEREQSPLDEKGPTWGDAVTLTQGKREGKGSESKGSDYSNQRVILGGRNEEAKSATDTGENTQSGGGKTSRNPFYSISGLKSSSAWKGSKSRTLQRRSEKKTGDDSLGIVHNGGNNFFWSRLYRKGKDVLAPGKPSL